MIRVRRRPKWGRRVRRYDKGAPVSKVGKHLETVSTVMEMEKRCVGAEQRKNALNQVYVCLIVLWHLISKRKYRMPGLSSDYYITHLILPASRPLLRVLSSFVSEHTAPSSFISSC
ncbi:hypothetical protein Y032_0006g3054 [Ancylostoma ceylanicum]|uniref:Uncharacterized protein n=1 Tax=Ancylostoma ceylanicum TaxID=53326 RepID=A0A016VS73_9BILA|nr:hypothetical protein Y032_0006g3054 [Ancylostoma ceylanicum]